MYLIIGILFVAAFLFYLRIVHSNPKLYPAEVAKIYCDGQVYEVGQTTLSYTNQNIHNPKGHLEELLIAIQALTSRSSIFPTIQTFSALAKMIEHPFFKKHIKYFNYHQKDHFNYNDNFGYGGIYLENGQGLPTVFVAGAPRPILKLSKSHHDQEEILRVAKKWTAQGFKTLGIAVGELDQQHKNILKRGVKEKMVMLGLVAINENKYN